MAKSQRPENTTIKVGKLLEMFTIQTNSHNVINGKRICNRPTLVKVAQVLATFTDHQTGSGAYSSLSTVAGLVQMSSRTVQRALARLEALGILKKERCHSWRLHRPTTWGFTRATIDKCIRADLASAKERSARYWARLRAFQEARSPGRSSSGGQVVRLPSPLRGGREESGTAGSRPPGENPLFSVLAALKEGRFVNPAT